ncbi:MAG TPA: CoA-binding protein, partial [Prosthecobacter sp.]|nr:CoA-binding protein [Prosthecobacter sp.]
MENLEAFFSPSRVAVIGATEKAGSVGRAVVENLRGFHGAVHLVNRKHPEVLGIKTLARVSDLPAGTDLAVVVTPAPAVPEILRECAAAGIPAAVVISAGFKEAGAAGRELEREVLEIARAASMRVIGPNCLGVMVPGTGLNATFAAAMAMPGNIAFLSQSGALCTAILDWSFSAGMGFSAFVSTGSMLDAGWADLIAHFADDPRTAVIVLYMESVDDAPAFLGSARRAALKKPLVVLKAGRTEAAARAAASHTGALTGSDSVFDAAFARAGVLRVDSIAELFQTAEVLACRRPPRGRRLAIVTNAG